MQLRRPQAGQHRELERPDVVGTSDHGSHSPARRVAETRRRTRRRHHAFTRSKALVRALAGVAGKLRKAGASVYADSDPGSRLSRRPTWPLDRTWYAWIASNPPAVLRAA